MVRRRSTVRFRKGAQLKRLIRTPRKSPGAIPGAGVPRAGAGPVAGGVGDRHPGAGMDLGYLNH
jgi:hypothetical protein